MEEKTHLHDNLETEKVSVKVAIKALGISSKTLYAYIKSGDISAIKDGNRTYLLADDIRLLKQRLETDRKKPREKVVVSETEIVGVPRGHYESLLTRLGHLEGERKLLLEYKTGLETQNQEITSLKQEMDNKLREAHEKAIKVEQELIKLQSLPFWKRIFRWNKNKKLFPETTP